MKRVYSFWLSFLFFLGLGWLVVELVQWQDFILFHPKGLLASKELELLIFTSGLMLLVVVPVLIMTIVFPWKYRADNPKTQYKPEWDHNYVLEGIWWGFPCAIIVGLSVLTWNSCHELDPFTPLESSEKTLEIQVIALQWRWLFIYPEQNIATMNYVQFPEKTPLRFVITADAPMNSFWIPQLGGQIYAMPGMQTLLYLISDKTGVFRGSSSNFSGKGFAGMRFNAEATSSQDFQSWVESVKKEGKTLGWNGYEQLALPSEDSSELFFSLEDQKLYDKILMKYGMTMP